MTVCVPRSKILSQNNHANFILASRLIGMDSNMSDLVDVHITVTKNCHSFFDAHGANYKTESPPF